MATANGIPPPTVNQLARWGNSRDPPAARQRPAMHTLAANICFLGIMRCPGGDKGGANSSKVGLYCGAAVKCTVGSVPLMPILLLAFPKRGRATDAPGAYLPTSTTTSSLGTLAVGTSTYIQVTTTSGLRTGNIIEQLLRGIKLHRRRQVAVPWTDDAPADDDTTDDND